MPNEPSSETYALAGSTTINQKDEKGTNPLVDLILAIPRRTLPPEC